MSNSANPHRHAIGQTGSNFKNSLFLLLFYLLPRVQVDDLFQQQQLLVLYLCQNPNLSQHTKAPNARLPIQTVLCQGGKKKYHSHYHASTERCTFALNFPPLSPPTFIKGKRRPSSIRPPNSKSKPIFPPLLLARYLPDINKHHRSLTLPSCCGKVSVCGLHHRVHSERFFEMNF